MRWFKLHYPKLAIFILAVVLAYIIFRNPAVDNFIHGLDNTGYFGIFIAGILLAFGFTAPFSVGFFLVLNPANMWLATLIGGLGAVLGDLVIFNFAKISFMDEFKRLEKTKLLREADNLLEKKIGHKIKIYLMYVFAEIIIASPLPDELGVSMIAGIKKIRQSFLAITSLALHFIGIYILLYL